MANGACRFLRDAPYGSLKGFHNRQCFSFERHELAQKSQCSVLLNPGYRSCPNDAAASMLTLLTDGCYTPLWVIIALPDCIEEIRKSQEHDACSGPKICNLDLAADAKQSSAHRSKDTNMGLFGAIKSTYKKSEAAVVVQNLLEHQAKVCGFDLDPATLANKLVELVWNSKPDVFDGKFGQRPHKITVAASALANGILLLEDNVNRDALVLSLGNILTEIQTNGRLYPLNSLDHQLLEGTASVFSEIAQKFSRSSLGRELDELAGASSYSTWDEWYGAFKVAAGQSNPQLKSNEQGASLIDLMEDKPLRTAFRDGVDPKSLAEEFAAHFDMTTFGIER